MGRRIAIAGGLMAAGAATLAAYHRLSGARLLTDVADELTLRAAPFDVLAARYLSNAERSDIVVSLTTIPSRVDRLATPLKSLFRQTRRPAEIRLNLPSFSVRERRACVAPRWLRECPAIRIVDCPDHGPATKVLPSLLAAAARARVLVVDDDRIYGERTIEELDDWHRVYPDAVLAGSGWCAPADLTDRPTTLGARLRREPYVPVLGSRVTAPVDVDVVQGLHGYVVQPRFFDLERLADYSSAPPEAVYCDDVWISAHARVPKYVVPLHRMSVTPIGDARAYKRTSLARHHNSHRDVERRANTVLLRHFREVWRRR